MPGAPKWPSPSSSVSSRARASRFALLVFSGVYPLVTLLLYAISPLTADWALWQRTLVLVPLVVVSMVWGLIPFLYRRFFSFIHPERCVAGR
jgi:antibiotic biosynthesis monooxygenase (ABM) superfamily enzyme